VTYESQPYFIVHECAGAGGLLQAAVNLARPGRFVDNGSGGPGGFVIRHNDHDAPCGPIQSVHDATA